MSEAKSKGISLPILLGIIVLIIAITVGTSFLMITFFTGKQTSGEIQTNVEKKLEKLGPKYELGEFVVNSTGVRGYRFIKTNVVAEVENEGIKKILDERSPQIRDAINEILRSATPEDISDPALVNIKKGILDKINEILVNEEVKSVWIPEFVLQ